MNRLSAGGAEVREAINDVGGRFIATVVDADGNPAGLMQPVPA